LHFEFTYLFASQVKGEDNSKAIYVFTAVTVVFLPLSFIAGLLGMNTVDIRNEKESQWLFWAVALPFTSTVLMICLCIAKHNFRLRKLVRSVLRKSGFLRRSRKGLGALWRRLLPEKWYGRGRRSAADWIDSVRDAA
jgi:ABC-type cobalamin transport system permease subunit